MSIGTHEPLSITVTINGTEYEREVQPRRLLSDFIRHDIGLTGTHSGCEHGVCGMCTILMDGDTARSCLTFAVQADGAEIETVENLGTIDDLHPIQQAFTEKHGLQCGFCTPAMLLTSKSLLDENPNPDREEIREAVANNLCRCTGYQQIVDSVERASELAAQADGGTDPDDAADTAGDD
ncbi:MAG: (2Fe-2S)-binding protein [Halobacteriota archaeon]